MPIEEPSITVGMPVYNDPEGLRRTVPSVFGQTWQGPLRLLAIDDGSTDETPDVLASMAEIYGHIDVIRNPTNQGRPFARNKILEHAGEGYLAWIDAGDLWHPRKLELQLAVLLVEEARIPDTPLLCTGPLRWVFTDRGANTIKVPDVAEDQLFNALTGTLHPYLQGLLGRAQHFRDNGGFDESLLRRQDYDFLVRFIGEGGRLVSTPDHTPLWTYLKSDVGTDPRIVADANRIIRRKHQRYYRRYPGRVARQVRSNQHRLVARFHANNGHTVQSVAYRTVARFSSPEVVLAATQLGRRAGRTPRATVRAVTRVVTRVVRPLLPMLRRSGVTQFARRLGVPRLLGAAGVMRVFYAEIKEDAGAAIRRPADVTAETPVGIEQLEAAVKAPEPSADPKTWLRLEEAYREAGLLHSAEGALRRGLERHGGDAELRVRLVELLALRGRWKDCVELWSSLEGIDDQDVRGLTYVLVVRALQRLGNPSDALALAEEGVRRSPLEPRLWDELYVSRAALVDWERTVLASRTASEMTDEDKSIGTVTDLGFLVGLDRPISGWVRSRSNQASSISLVVNGTPVATTHAAAPTDGSGQSRFSLSCHDLRQFVGDGDIISVECEGEALPIEGYGYRCEVQTGYESRFDVLQKRLDAGYVFTKFGALRKGNSNLRRERILTLYDDVSALLERSHAYPTFPFYGNLLGAVREHDLIAHDVGGFDMGYISRHHRPEDVRREFVEICHTLVRHGYHLRVEPWSTYIRANYYDRFFVDLNYAWFNDVGELNFSYGWRFPPVTDRERVYHPRECPIGSHLVRVPGNAEEVLEQFYGPSWPVPDQGYALDVGLKRDWTYLLTIDDMVSLEQFDPDRVEARLQGHPDAVDSGVPTSR